jgi:PIN domain nuclease of toxin-antitoxin system
VKILLDTHIFLWALSAPNKIAKERRGHLENPANIIHVSSVSVAELMIKASLGKLQVDFDPVDMMEKCGFEPLSFHAEDALLLKDMAFHHKDPFDRMLIAQGIANQIPIMTDDEKFRSYGCRLI